MAVAALIVFAAFLVLVAGVRSGIQVRRTGDLGDRRKAARRNPTQRRIDGLAALGALAVGVASPVAALWGLDPVVRSPGIAVGGLVLAVLGSVAAFGAQLSMGDSWRTGVDPDERTALVTTGPFGLVRNPILSSVTAVCLGLTLMVPTVIAVLGLAAVVASTQLLVRRVEEPYLRRVHGQQYARYAAATGRFVPGIGRLRGRGGGTEAPRSYQPLPGRTEDRSAAFEQCLAELVDLFGAEPLARAPDTGQARYRWQHQARRVVAEAARRTPVREESFEPLVRAAIYDPDPSFNRQLIEPALAAFGRRRVKLALLEHLRSGTDPERAGAARAWYWAQAPLRGGTRTPTPESKAEYEAHADLERQWQETALHVFVANDDLDVRRCILPGLDLRAEHCPEELRATVAAAVHLARTHPDDYLRHRVEHQV